MAREFEETAVLFTGVRGPYMGLFAPSLPHPFIHLFSISPSMRLPLTWALGFEVNGPQCLPSGSSQCGGDGPTCAKLSPAQGALWWAEHGRLWVGGPQGGRVQPWAETVRSGFLQELVPQLRSG